MTDPDLSLTSYARDRRPDDFGRLVERTAPALNRFLARVLGQSDPALLDELAQRTYIAVARKAGAYRGPSAVAWILGIAFREVRSHRREICRVRAREVAMADDLCNEIRDEKAASAPGPDEIAAAEERVALLRAALERLERRERLAVELVHLEGLSYVDAGAVLEAPAGTVKSRVHRALEKLRERLGPALAAHCIALLTAERAASLGPAVPASLACRGEVWSQAALASIAVNAALDTGAGAAAAAGGASTAALSGPGAQLTLAAATILAGVAVWMAWKSPQPGANPPPIPVASLAGATPLDGAPPPPPRSSRSREGSGASTPAAPPPATDGAAADHFWVRGTVIETDGTPVPGVTLRVAQGWDSLEHFPGDPMQVPAWLEAHAGPSRTGLDGRFEVPFLRAPRGHAPLANYKDVAERWHEIHLTATAGDGRERVVRVRTRPVSPPEVEVTFAEPARIRGRVARGPGVPELQDAVVVAVLADDRPGRYAHFVRGTIGAGGEFALEPLEPGEWRLEAAHLPAETVVAAPAELSLRLEPGEEADIVLHIAAKPGLCGQVASPRGWGVAGGVLVLVDDAGTEVERIPLGFTPAGRRLPGGTLARKGPAGAIDVAALPVPFRFAQARSGTEYTMSLEVAGVVADRFGPFRAPAADLRLQASAHEPDGELALVLDDVDPRAARDGRASLFSGTTLITQAYFDSSGWPGSILEPPVFIGLPAGRYSLEVYVKEAWDRASYRRAVVELDIADREKKTARMRFQPALPVQIRPWTSLESPGAVERARGLAANLLLHRLDAEPSAWLHFQGSLDDEGGLSFAVSPGTYCIRVPGPVQDHAEGTCHPGQWLRLGVASGGSVTTSICSAGGELTINVADLKQRAATADIAGTTRDGLPVRVSNLAGSAGRWQILGLPAGDYRVSIAVKGEDAPAFDRQIELGGDDLHIAASEAGDPPAAR